MRQDDAEHELELVLLGAVLGNKKVGSKVFGSLRGAETTKGHQGLYSALQDCLKNGAVNGELERWLKARGVELQAGEQVVDGILRKVQQNGRERIKKHVGRLAYNASMVMGPEQYWEYVKGLVESTGPPAKGE